MTMQMDSRTARSLYNRDAILSASPSRLLTMLFDRLLLDLQHAEAAQLEQDFPRASPFLLHAQAIIAELTSTLDVERWDGGQDLLSIYLFSSTKLVSANIDRDVNRTREVISLMEPLRQTWHEAAAMVAAERAGQSEAPEGMLGFG